MRTKILIALALLLTPLSQVHAAYGYNSLQGRTYRANLLRTGAYEAEGVPKFTGIKWTTTLGGKVKSSAVVADGKVYIGTEKGFYCLDATSGKTLWEFKTQEPIYSSATLAYGKVFFNSEDGFVYAVDASSGELKWKQKIKEKRAMFTSPTVAYGIVFTNEGANGFDVHSWGGKMVVGFDVETGKQVFEQYAGKGPQGMGAIALTDKIMVCPDKSFDLETGQATSLVCPPVAHKFDSDAHDYQPAVVYLNKVYQLGQRAGDFAGNSPIGNLRVFDINTGKALWEDIAYSDYDRETKKPKDGKDHSCNGAICAAENKIFWGNMDGNLMANDAEKGKVIWKVDLKSAIRSPSYASGVLYVGLDSGELVALDAKNGTVLWREKIGKAPLVSSPVIEGKMIVIGCDDGNLYAIE